MPSTSLTLRRASATLALLSLLTRPITGSYQLAHSYTGESFLDNLNFVTGPDPDGGFATFEDQTTARLRNLVLYDSHADHTVLRVDDRDTLESTAPGRPSVRIESKDSFHQGLIISDLSQIPGASCGTWAKYSISGSAGIVDIVESVNGQLNNLMSLHSDKSGTIQSSNTFNSGIYATEISSSFIKTWVFSQSTSPTDIANETPDPKSWGTPLAEFALSCDIDSHRIVFETSFCGPSVAQAWESDENCRNIAPTCEEYVAGNPGAFSGIQWAIKSVKIYQQSAATTSSSSTLATPFTTPEFGIQLREHSINGQDGDQDFDNDDTFTSDPASNDDGIGSDTDDADSSDVPTNDEGDDNSGSSDAPDTNDSDTSNPTLPSAPSFNMNFPALNTSTTATNSTTPSESTSESLPSNTSPVSTASNSTSVLLLSLPANSTAGASPPSTIPSPGTNVTANSTALATGSSPSIMSSMGPFPSSNGTSGIASATGSSHSTLSSMAPFPSINASSGFASATGSMRSNLPSMAPFPSFNSTSGIASATGLLPSNLPSAAPFPSTNVTSDSTSATGLSPSKFPSSDANITSGIASATGSLTSIISSMAPFPGTNATSGFASTTESLPSTLSSTARFPSLNATSGPALPSSSSPSTWSSMAPFISASATFGFASASGSSSPTSSSSRFNVTSGSASASSPSSNISSGFASATSVSTSTNPDSGLIANSSGFASITRPISSTVPSTSTNITSGSISATGTSPSNLPSAFATIAGTYRERGCYADPDTNGGPLSNSNEVIYTRISNSTATTSVYTCLTTCGAGNYTYAGYEPDFCFCSNTFTEAPQVPCGIGFSRKRQAARTVVIYALDRVATATSIVASAPTSGPIISTFSSALSSIMPGVSTLIFGSTQISNRISSVATSSSYTPSGSDISNTMSVFSSSIGPSISLTTASTSMITSTVYATTEYTITSCAPTITDCPARMGHVTTETIALYTTVCPITEIGNVIPTQTPAPVDHTISTIYTTTIYTITSCAATVTDCPARMGMVTTKLIPLYTTVIPVESQGPIYTTVLTTTYIDICSSCAAGLETYTTIVTLTLPSFTTNSPSSPSHPPTIPMITTAKVVTISGSTVTIIGTIPAPAQSLARSTGMIWQHTTTVTPVAKFATMIVSAKPVSTPAIGSGEGGNEQDGNGQGANGQVGNGKSGDGQSRNGESGYREDGKGQGGDGQGGNGQDGNGAVPSTLIGQSDSTPSSIPIQQTEDIEIESGQASKNNGVNGIGNQTSSMNVQMQPTTTGSQSPIFTGTGSVVGWSVSTGIIAMIGAIIAL